MLGPDEARLILRQDLGEILVHAHGRGDGTRRPLAVARHHDKPRYALRVQGVNDTARLTAQRVLYAYDRRKHAGYAQIQMRILARQSVEARLLACGQDAALILEHEVLTADDDLFTADAAGHAVRDDVIHLGVALLMPQTAALGLGHDGLRHGVGVVLLQARGQTQHLRLIPAAEGDDLRHARHGVGQRAGLVEHEGLRLRNGLKEAPALDGDMIGAGLLHRGQHRDGHGQLQRAGEIDHQHGQRAHGVARDKPYERRRAEAVGHKAVRQMRRVALRAGLELFRLLYHPDYAVIAPAAAGLFHAHGEAALFYHRARVDVAARSLAHGKRFARDGRLIDHGLAVRHLSVQRDHPAGRNAYRIARADLTHGNEHVPVRRLQPDLVHVQRHAARKVGHGLLVRPLVQRLPDAKQEHDGARRGKVAA